MSTTKQEPSQVQCYERKENMWITGNRSCTYGDIYLPMNDTEYHIVGEDVFVKATGASKEEAITKDTLHLGESLEILGVTITFFADHLELMGDTSEWEIKLSHAKGEGLPFPSFPFYKRSPRIIYHVEEETITLKAPPKKPTFSKSSIFQTILPTLTTLGFTIGMSFVLKRGVYVYMSVGMTLITICFTIKNLLSQRKQAKLDEVEREKVYRDYLLKTRSKILKKRAAEAESMAYMAPFPKTLEKMVTQYDSRFFERTNLDDDFLCVNLGYRSGASKVKVSYQNDDFELDKDPLVTIAKKIPEEFKKISDIPVMVDLKKAHLGLVGSKKNIHEELRYLFMQLCFFQSYHDLEIVFLYQDAYREEFQYLRWYPHCTIHSMNVVGCISEEQVKDQVLGSLQQILKDRALKVASERQETVFKPHLLFVIDEPKFIVNHAIMEYLQANEVKTGFSIIYTTDQQANLPENIHSICLLENATDGRLLLNEGERVNTRFTTVSLTDISCEQMARRTSALIHEQGISNTIPDAITFFDLYQVERPEELAVEKRWASHHAGKSLAVPIGVRGEEDYVELNLHEKAHGPHGLVAGTTGSGKSEIIQTYILSLAVNFHPHEVGFLLIDYKGGGMANLFAKLPHLLGTITNLDKAESMRAMASIKSELARRQMIFNQCGVNHINGYSQLFHLGKVKEPLPHLFLISDEFAELKKEQPEFMSELISTARIGRSLGIHLILATQKPSGVVDDQIWTNSKFKLCLKVQDVADSREMLKTPDAASITQAGRAYLQVGNNEIYELFQSAWSGATYEMLQTEEEKEDDRVYLINRLGQGELLNQNLEGSSESNQMKATQLDVVVEHLAQVYEQMHTIPVRKTWIPSLPEVMVSPYTQNLQDSASFTKLDCTLGVGMMDIPEEQAQREYVVDFLTNGHLIYQASSGYGKSFFATGLILGLAMKNSVSNLQFYLLDWGNSALIKLRDLPHVADYMGLEEEEKFEKFKKMMMEEMNLRKHLFAKVMAQNFSVYNQMSSETLRAIVIVVDNYDVIQELGDDAVAFIQKVSRDGASLGIYILLTASRQSVMRTSTRSNFKEKIAGFNFDAGENSALLGRSSYSLTEDNHGRVLVNDNGIHVMQVYTPVAFQNEMDYNAKIRTLVEAIKSASSEEKAKGIPMLPEALTYEALPMYSGYREDAFLVPLGIETEEMEVRYLDMSNDIAWIVGSSGTGRTTCLSVLMKKAISLGATVYCFDAKNEGLRRFSEMTGVSYASEASGYKAMLDSIVALTKERQEQYEEKKLDDVTLTMKRFYQGLPAVYILIDVVQNFLEVTQESEEFTQIIMQAVNVGIYVCATSDDKISKIAKNHLLKSCLGAKDVLLLGNVKNQTLYTLPRIRDNGMELDQGYLLHTNQSQVERMKLIRNAGGMEE
ncbi:MAG: type VII secretion protein EssC [Lachnospiraceae bacterium]|nr:type VII secretion protein EssC [Lachnospiraceae bacterium]